MSEFNCPECGHAFLPSPIGEIGRHSVVDGVAKDEIVAVRLTCGGTTSHTWDLPGKRIMDVIAACPELAPGYISTLLADKALGALMNRRPS